MNNSNQSIPPELAQSVLSDGGWGSLTGSGKGDLINFDDALLDVNINTSLGDTQIKQEHMGWGTQDMDKEKEELKQTVYQLNLVNQQYLTELLKYQQALQQQKAQMQAQQLNGGQAPVVARNDDYLQILNEDEYPFPKYTVLEGTVRPYPVLIIKYPGNKQNLVVKAEPAPGFKYAPHPTSSYALTLPSSFTVENHIAFFKPKEQNFVEHRQVGDVIVFDDLHILGVGNAEGESVQLDFFLYNIVGTTPTLLATRRSPPITVYNHSQYLPAPNISKLLPNWAIAGTRPKVDAFGPLFLRKNNILECQVIDEQNKEIALLKGTAIVRKRNCFHSFSFVAPEHPAGRVWIRARYKDRDFGEARPFEYWLPPTQGQNLNQQTIQANSQRPNSSVMDPSNLAQQSTNTMGFPNNFYSNVGQFSYQGNIHSLKAALDQHTDQAKDAINQRDNNGCSSLFWACQAGHAPVVQLLLERGADPSMTNRRGESPLHAACTNGTTATIKALLDKGARWSLTDNRGMTVLHHAALNVSSDLEGKSPRDLIAWSRDSHKRRSSPDQFLNILIKGHLDAVKCLFDNVEAEDLLSVKDREGMLPLHAAIVSTNLTVTRFILERMVELDEPLDRKDKSGMTPLHLAVSLNDENITPLLVFYLNQTQNINAFNARDDSKETPLFYAVRNNNTNLARFLLQNRSDANLVNSEKESALFVAVREKSEDMVQLLLEMGADTNIRNVRGETPFEAEEIPEPLTKPRTWPLTQLTPAKLVDVPAPSSPTATNNATPIIKVPTPQTSPKVTPTPTPLFTPTATPTPTPTLVPLVTGPTTKQSPVLSPVTPTRLGITDSTIEYITRELGGPKTNITTSNKEETALIMQLDRLQQEMREREKREEQYKSKIINSEQEMLNMKGQIEQLMKQVQQLTAVVAGDRV